MVALLAMQAGGRTSWRNSQHVETVKQGAKAIKAWREKNSDVPLDLQGANSSRANLRWTDLIGAALGGANLRGAIVKSPEVE